MRQYTAGQRLDRWPSRPPLPSGQTPTLWEVGAATYLQILTLPSKKTGRLPVALRQLHSVERNPVGGILLLPPNPPPPPPNVSCLLDTVNIAVLHPVITGTGLHQECLNRIVVSGRYKNLQQKASSMQILFCTIKFWVGYNSGRFVLSDCYPGQARKRHQMWLYKTACPTAFHMRNWKRYHTKPFLFSTCSMNSVHMKQKNCKQIEGYVRWVGRVTTEEDGSIPPNVTIHCNMIIHWKMTVLLKCKVF